MGPNQALVALTIRQCGRSICDDAFSLTRQAAPARSYFASTAGSGGGTQEIRVAARGRVRRLAFWR